MNKNLYFIFCFILILLSCGSMTTNQVSTEKAEFDLTKDILLLNYDCKTDVDDVHSMAAFSSLLNLPKYNKINFLVVAGTYGTQEGEYVPPNSLLTMFCPYQFADAHENLELALKTAESAVKVVLNNGGNVWVAEGGQSDFTSQLVSRLKADNKKLDTKKRVFVVQHSDWNEKVTTADHLAYVKGNTTYIKIPDGNTVDNGTPGFNCEKKDYLVRIFPEGDLRNIWNEALSISDTYNGKDDRYFNENISNSGLDFSDFIEVHKILNLPDMKDCKAYFEFVSEQN